MGITEGMAVRISMLSAALWWAGVHPHPVPGDPQPARRATWCPRRADLAARSFGQLWATLKGLRRYPVALTFLVAYLFFNDGIQTVIASASTYGIEELGF